LTGEGLGTSDKVRDSGGKNALSDPAIENWETLKGLI